MRTSNRLVLMVSLMVALVGVIIPVLITIYQRWTSKQDRERLVRETAADVDSRLQDRLTHIEESLRARLDSLGALHDGLAESHHVQDSNAKHLYESLIYYGMATEAYPQADYGRALGRLAGAAREGLSGDDRLMAHVFFDRVDSEPCRRMDEVGPERLLQVCSQLEVLTETTAGLPGGRQLSAQQRHQVEVWIEQLAAGSSEIVNS